MCLCRRCLGKSNTMRQNRPQVSEMKVLHLRRGQSHVLLESMTLDHSMGLTVNKSLDWPKLAARHWWNAMPVTINES